jgi:type I restriction enzyme, S subunit
MVESLRLGDHCTKIGSGATPRGGKDSYLADGPISLIRSQNVLNDRFSENGLVHISEEQAALLQNVEVRPGDVLLNITGDSVARVCQVDSRVLPARVNQHVAIIRPNPNRIDPPFLRYFLVSPVMQAHMLAFAAAGATRNALTKRMIENFRIPAFSISEQRAIASVLGTLDDKIDLNRRMNDTLQGMVRAVFKDWFVDFGPTVSKMEGRDRYLPPEIWSLFPDHLDKEGKPEGWTIGNLGDYVRNFDAKRVPVSGAERAKRRGPYPYHGATGIMDYVDDYLFDGIYLLVGEDGSVIKEEDGTAFTQYVWGKIWVNNHAHVLQGKGSVSTEQLFIYFQHEPVSPYITGAVQLKLSQGRMNSMPFIYAGDELCRKFAIEVAPLFARIRCNADESKTLATTRDLLLPKLMSGQIRIRGTKQIGTVK